MWVRSLSLPPPHPLVLTGKGRSFLQPKLPTFPPQNLSCVCVLDVSHIIKQSGELLLLSLPNFVVAWCKFCLFLFFFLCVVQFIGRSGGSA